MTQAQLKLIKSSMKMAAKRGYNPYDNAESFGKAYSTLAKMNGGKHTCTRSEADANRWLSR